jgi:beta-glucosidase
VVQINFHYTLSSPDEKIKNDFFSARFEGQIKPTKTGNYKIGLDGNDGFRLYLDGKLLIDNWTKQTYSTRLTDFYFEANKTYNIKVEFYEPTANAQLRMIWTVDVDNDWQQKINEAVELAKQSDVTIVDVGIIEGEFQDRALLSLPAHQEWW